MKIMKLLPAASLLVPAIAAAQPELTDTGHRFDHAVPAVDRNAFEIGIATGYTQGGGKLGGTLGNLEDVAGPGGTVEVDLGYRLIPQLAVGVYATLSKNQHGDAIAGDTSLLAATAGIQGAWHFRSDAAIDPWVSLGTGWRGLWLSPERGKVTSLQGFELARLQVGADYRITKDIAISPVIGASVSMFVSQDSPMTTSYTEISDKQVNVTGFAGLSGRFDFGGPARARASAASLATSQETWQ
jgi:hypothetical protein